MKARHFKNNSFNENLKVYYPPQTTQNNLSSVNVKYHAADNYQYSSIGEKTNNYFSSPTKNLHSENILEEIRENDF